MSISAALKRTPFKVTLAPKEEHKALKEGAFGSIYLHSGEKDKPTLYGKRFLKPWTQSWFNITTEIAALRALEHPNIIQAREVIIETPRKVENYAQLNTADLDTTYLSLVLSAGSMDLYEWYEGDTYDTTLIPSLMYQMLSAIAYMHARGFLHRDLKPQNIILFTEGEGKKKGNAFSPLPLCQLADFGSALFGVSPERREKRHAEVITLWYRPPELLVPFIKTSHPVEKVEYDCSTDLWSIGVILYNLLTRRHLFNSIDEKSMAETIGEAFNAEGHLRFPYTRHFIQEKTGERFPHITDAALDLLYALLRINPEERISAVDALAHPYFQHASIEKSIRLFRIPTETKRCGENMFIEHVSLTSSPLLRTRIRKVNDSFDPKPSPLADDLAVSLFERIYTLRKENEILLYAKCKEEELPPLYALACLSIADSLVSTRFSLTSIFRIAARYFEIKQQADVLPYMIWIVIMTLAFDIYTLYTEEIP